MTTLVQRKIETPVGDIIMQVHYYDQYLVSNGGALPLDIAAHALFHYSMVASNAYYQAYNSNFLVEESKRSPTFTLANAKQLFESIANWYGIHPRGMQNYWPAVEAQRRALGLSTNAELPEQFKLKGGWGN